MRFDHLARLVWPALAPHRGGLALLAGLLTISAGPEAAAVCTPTQTGAVLEEFSGLSVARNDDGTYGLDGVDCSESFNFVRVGFGTTFADGIVTLTNGASLSLLNNLQVAQVGTADVMIASGSQVTTNDCWVSYRDFDAGSNSSGVGLLTVTGSGTQVTCNDELLVGVDGQGTLEVTDSAQMTAGRMTTSAFEFGATGTIRVTSGASLSITGSAGATHVFSVHGPGVIDVDGGSFAFTDPSAGILTICTASSCTADIRVANQGLLSAHTIFVTQRTTITLEDGTIETVQNLLRLAGNSLLQGSGSVVGDLDLRSDLVPGIDGIGSIAVVSDDASDGNLFTTIGGKIVAEIAGPAFFDTVTVDGDLSFTGTIQVPFVDGFVPTLGDRFQIITVGGITNWSPNTVSITGLPADLLAQTSIVEEPGAIVVQVPEPGPNSLAAASLLALALICRRRGAAAVSGNG